MRIGIGIDVHPFAEGAEGFIYYVEVAVFEHLEPEVEIDGVGGLWRCSRWFLQ